MNLPPGFELDAAPAAPQAVGLPPGFELDEPAQRGVADKLLGTTGERYQTWPERLVRSIGSSAVSGATLPGDAYAGRAQMPSSGAVPGSVPFGDVNSAGARVADLTGLAFAANPGIIAGDRAIAGVTKALTAQKPVTPTAEALKEGAAQGFTAAKNMGVDINPSAMKDLAVTLEQQLQNRGILAEHAPTAYATLGRLRDAPADAVVTISDLHNLRQAFGNAAGNFSHPKDTLAGSMGRDAVDAFLKAIPEKDVLAGPASAASATLRDAIGNHAAAMRSESVTGRTDLAALRAKVANSGQNLDNATRQRFVDIASEGKASRGFSDQEIAKALTLAEGSAPTNTARFIGNALGGGGGLGMALTAGMGGYAGAALTGSPFGAALGAVPPVIGATAKKIANALTRREAKQLDKMVRQRSPMHQQQIDNPTMIPQGAASREALIRALLLGGEPGPARK